MTNKVIYNLLESLYRSPFVRHIISYFYRIIYFHEYPAISKFVNLNNNQSIIAINAHEIYHFNHIKSLYHVLAKDSSCTVILIGSNPNKIQLPEYQEFLKKNNLILNKDLISYIWLSVLKPDIFIENAITPYHQLCNTKTIKVLFAHGLSSLGFSKNHAHIKESVSYDYILSTGPYQKKTLELAANQYKVKLPKIIHGGFIRGDILAENAAFFDRHDFNKKCGLDDKNTVFFAPTWGEFSATADWIDPIADLSTELDFNLLIKLHPLMLKGQTKWETAGIDWPNKLGQLGKNKNIHICELFELEDYMLASDIMITDASSVGMEFMFLEKPVIFLPTPQFFNLFGRDKPIFWVRNGLEVQDTEEFKEKLTKVLSNSDFTPDYDLNNISFHPGNTLEYISNWIINLTAAPPSPEK